MAWQTKLLAVIGHPVSHSLSPAMHRAAIQEYGMDACYTGFDVDPSQLEKVVESMRTLGFHGWNVTIPHKQAMLNLVDELTDTAIRIGAVNTVFYRDGKWIGDNTDGDGYLASLVFELGFFPAQKQVVVLGAGGAARSIVDALLRVGAKDVWILNRDVVRAETLRQQMASYYGEEKIHIGSLHTFPSIDVDLLINTTPVGLKGHLDGQLPISSSVMTRHMIISDIVYKPFVTPFLNAAKDLGASVHGGLGMLVEQGALAFERWFGVKPETQIMRDAAMKKIFEEGEL